MTGLRVALGLGILLVSSTRANAAGYDRNEVVWVEDAVPPGASLAGEWTWSTTTVRSGAQSHTETPKTGIFQHFFEFVSDTFAVSAGDVLTTSVYISTASPLPQMLMLQFKAEDGWEHRAYWGANQSPWGVDGTASRRGMGALPATNKWVTLTVPAELVDLAGRRLTGMAFTLSGGGRVYWDRSGKLPAAPPAKTVRWKSGFDYPADPDPLENVLEYSFNVQTPRMDRATNYRSFQFGMQYSGNATSSTSANYAYFRVYDNLNVPIGPSTILQFFVEPFSAYALSKYAAVDLVMSDGTVLRDSGAVDQYQVRVHPALQGAKPQMSTDLFNNVWSWIGPYLNGKTLRKVLIAYDHPAGTGVYLGAVDDVKVYDPFFCGVYSVGINQAGLQRTSQWADVMLDYAGSEYFSGFVTMINQTAPHMRAFVTIYYDHTWSTQQITDYTRQQADLLRPNRAYMAGVYLFDEPELNGFSSAQTQAAVNAWAQYMPGMPTMITVGASATQTSPAGLSYRGIEFYGKDSKDLNKVRSKLATEASRANGAKLIAIPRMWDDEPPLCCSGNFGSWTDTEIADMNRNILPVLKADPNVAGVIGYVWNGTSEDINLENLPLTEAVVREFCAKN